VADLPPFEIDLCGAARVSFPGQKCVILEIRGGGTGGGLVYYDVIDQGKVDLSEGGGLTAVVQGCRSIICHGNLC